MNDLESNNSTLESIKHIDEDGNEYWKARELMKALQYTKWDNFKKVIEEAIKACKRSNNNELDHFPEVGKTIPVPKGGIRKVQDYKLSRYACYLIVQNGDPRKKVIALGQTYFAIQTRKQELSEKEYNMLSEDEKRLYKREIARKGNYTLNLAARDAGVKNFAKFHNAGYKGLYNGETANDIAKRKGLRYREDILDNMCSEELASNIFRIAQTEAKLKRDKINNENDANDTHYNVGKKVRETIKELGGTMPEDLPTPEKSLKELKKDNTKRIKANNED